MMRSRRSREVFLSLLFLSIVGQTFALWAQPADEQIRPYDRLTLANGNVVVGTVITPNVDVATAIEFRTIAGSVIRVPRANIAEIVARQTAEQVYARKKRRVRRLTDLASRAREELALGIWCRTPLVELDGEAPAELEALGHLWRAVRLDPALKDAYPHILAYLPDPEALGPDALEEEAELYHLALEGGQESPELEFRLAVMLAQKLDAKGEAVRHLERFLSSSHDNAGQLRRARQLLAGLYVERGEEDKVQALYERRVVAPSTDPANFEPYFELARLQMRHGSAEAFKKARELFAKAQAIQPEFLDIQGYLAAMAYHEGRWLEAEKILKAFLSKDKDNFAATLDLALVRLRLGRADAVEKTLRALLPQAGREEAVRIHLGLGNIAETRSKDADAVAAYRAALSVIPDHVESQVALAFALARTGETAEARGLAEGLLRNHRENLHVFATCSRLFGEIELADGKPEAALVQFQRAVETGGSDTRHKERNGILLMREGKLEAGFALLKPLSEGAIERPDTINALAFYHYSRGDQEQANTLFQKVAKATRAPRLPSQRAYARRGIDLIRDLASLEVWEADLQLPDSPDLKGWEETERFGVEIAHRGNQIVLAGTQSAAADGITMAMLERPVEVRTFARLLLSGRPLSGQSRLGLRLEGSSRAGATAGLVFYKDVDGVMRFQVKTTRSDWEPGEVTEDTDPKKGKLVYDGKSKWPQDANPHTLEIRRSMDLSRRTTSARSATFDLLLDGEPIAWNVQVSGLGGKFYQVGFSGQTTGVGVAYSLAVDGFKVYRQRPVSRTRSGKR